MPDKDQSFESFMDESLEGLVTAPDPTPDPDAAAVVPDPVAVLDPAVVPDPAAAPDPVATPAPADELVPDALSDKLSKMLAGEPAEPVPAEPVAPDPEDTPPANASAAAQKKWAEMRQDVKWRKANEPELQRLKAAYEELQKQAVGPDPVAQAAHEAAQAQLKLERDSYLQELQVSRVEATPEFKENILKPMEGTLERGRALAKRYELPESSVTSALNEPDESKRGELLANLAGTMSEPDRMGLYRMGDQLQEYRSQADFIRSNAKVALEALQKSQQTQHKEQLAAAQKEWSAALDQVSAGFRANLPLLKTVDGDDEWNKGTQDIETLVRNTKLYELPPVELGKILYQAATLPRALLVIDKLVASDRALRARLAKYKTATPGAGEGGGTVDATVPSNPELGFLEAVG